MLRPMKLVAALSAIALSAVFAAPAFADPLIDTNLDAVDQAQPSSLQAQSVADEDSQSMPDNPDAALPSTVASNIPDDATVVSENHAVTTDGKLKDLETGATVTDPDLVGTTTSQPDPLAKTDGESFIPVQADEVKTKVEESGNAASTGAIKSSAGATVRTVALGGNEYGVYWGTYNGTPAFFNANGSLFVQQAKGVIDVSAWQGKIDWQAAKNDGVEGAIIRIGYGWGNGLDKTAAYNIRECKRLGIPFGVYLYSYAYDYETAAAEGSNVVELLSDAGVSPASLSYPVFYDLEAWSWEGHAHPTNPRVYETIVDAWYEQLRDAGYNNLSVYSYTNYLQNELNSSAIHAKTRWVAQYGAKMQYSAWSTNDRGWQYTSGGSVNGISGRVDLNAFGNAKAPVEQAAANSVYRVYNPNSGLHHYTTSYAEALQLTVAGWRYEGVSFRAASSGSAVYRVYNPNDGNHLFTMKEGEKTALVKLGWRAEGIAWYVDSAGSKEVYRLYNPNAGEHMYTMNKYEYDQVGKAGWRQEGVAWRVNG